MAHIVDDIKKGVKGVKGMGDVLRGEALEATDRAFESRNSRAGQEADIISESKHRATAEKGRRDIEGMDEMFARREWARKHADGAHPLPSGEPAGLHGTGGVPSHGTAQPTSLTGQPAGYEHSTSTTQHNPLGHHAAGTAQHTPLHGHHAAGTTQPTSLTGQPAGYEHSTSTTQHTPLHGHHAAGTTQPTSLTGQSAGYEQSTSTATHAPLHGHHAADTAHGSAGFPTQSAGGYTGENLQTAPHGTQHLQNTSYPDQPAQNAHISHQEPIGSHLGHGRSAAPGVSAPADAVHPTEGTYQGSRNLGGYP